MRCPFLRGAKVKYCRASAYRKLLEAASSADADRCYTSAYTACPAAAAQIQGAAVEPRCPFLQETDAEFCAAAGPTKYIPATNPLLSRCNSDDHAYCEVYLAQADPEGARRPARSQHTQFLDGVPVPRDLSYAPNHMWLDVAPDGHCHIGVDAFLAKVIGSVEKVGFATPRESDRPVAILTTHGVDLLMVFPNRLQHCAANVYLRTAPSKLTDDPYGAGWLFQGVEPTLPWDTTGDVARAGLIRGDAAAAWMQSEAMRLTEFVHQRLARTGGVASAADGGVVDGALVAHLGHDDTLDLFNDFFAFARTGRNW